MKKVYIVLILVKGHNNFPVNFGTGIAGTDGPVAFPEDNL